ncbi:myosin-2 essential light chain-like [Actinia tenebrosa]|uniref:Myosin-2 essential light chain-like n=1 Tax=Actinia tenebrosa TaxID=6105 RepID=A0A6P8J4P7_ACTTE|nr:myosin-2 essential light chain-like [Actinia tenebrosa]
MTDIPKDKLDEINDAFSLFDEIGDGKLDYKDIPKLLRSMNLNPVGSDLEKVVEDYKSKERIDIETFLAIYSEFLKKTPPAKEDFLEGLKVFDREGHGTIDSGNFRALLCNRGDSKLTEEEADIILAGHEDVAKGEVNYNELIDFVMAG